MIASSWAELRQDLLPRPEELEGVFDRLWPICRSITGEGFRKSLAILGELLPLETVDIPSGTRVLDWTVPKEWNIEDAWIEDESGRRVVDFRESNLHVVGYSAPVDERLSLDELQPRLHSLPDQPDAVPYLTSYYQETWGFCMSHRRRQALAPGRYRAVIRSTLAEGRMTLAHAVLPATAPPPADGKDEVLVSTYLCHPSMANNELSGPLLAAFLYRALTRLPERRLRYRFVMVPEAIGAVAYLDRFGEELTRRCRGGLVATMCADGRNLTYKRSRRGDAEIDRVAENVLRSLGRPHRLLDFFPWGSDERQYCSPGFDLPVGSLFHSRYGTGEFPEYHTSLDDKSAISFEALRQTVGIALDVARSLEFNRTYVSLAPRGEPMLGRRGLYPAMGTPQSDLTRHRRLMWVLAYADGKHDLCAIADKAGCSVPDLAEAAESLERAGLLRPA